MDAQRYDSSREFISFDQDGGTGPSTGTRAFSIAGAQRVALDFSEAPNGSITVQAKAADGGWNALNIVDAAFGVIPATFTAVKGFHLLPIDGSAQEIRLVSSVAQTTATVRPILIFNSGSLT